MGLVGTIRGAYVSEGKAVNVSCELRVIFTHCNPLQLRKRKTTVYSADSSWIVRTNSRRHGHMAHLCPLETECRALPAHYAQRII